MMTINSIQEIQEAISQNEYVLLFIGDSACSTSRALDNKIEEFGQKHSKVKVLYTLLAALPSLASEYMVFVAPLVILFVEGKEVYREGRFVEFAKLEKFIQ